MRACAAQDAGNDKQSKLTQALDSWAEGLNWPDSSSNPPEKARIKRGSEEFQLDLFGEANNA